MFTADMRFLTIIPFFVALGSSIMSADSGCENVEGPNSTTAPFGLSVEEVSMTSGSETTFQQFTIQQQQATTTPTACLSSTQDIEVIIQISDFIGTAVINLTRTPCSSTTLDEGLTSTTISSTTTTQDVPPYNTLMSGSTAVPSYNYNSSITSLGMGNMTAGFSNVTTNGSFAAYLSPTLTPTAVTASTNMGTTRHIHTPGLFPFILFQIAAISLV
jgi:hypothetical protein